MSALTVTDLFCGAGGSSLGAGAAGLEIVMAANHWSTAIEVHQANHPDARHDCADISAADPRRYPSTNILLASPECTNHSQARGVSRRSQDASLFDQDFDPAAEKSRATMWCVVRFAEQIAYDAVIVENVVEATKWIFWHRWLDCMTDLGYQYKVVSHNSMHHGVAQSRDRIYVVFTRKGLTPDLELELAGWCLKCGATKQCRQAWKNGRTVGRYRTQYIYACTTCGNEVVPATEPAATIIDWDLACPRIGDRKRPLADKTRGRILAGLQRYGWAPVTTSGAGNGFERTPGNRARPVFDAPVDTQTCTAATALATPPGFLFQTAHGGRVTDLKRPHPTVNASDDRQSLVMAPDAIIVPQRANGNAYPVTDPLGAVVAGGNHHGLLMRNNTSPNGPGAEMCTLTSEPARTMTTSGHQSLLMPYYGTSHARPTDRPTPTVTTKDRCALINVDEIVDDCGFRMLEPHEIAAAMAFPVGYIPDTYTKKDRVKLAGNAVTPPTMTWIAGRVAQAIEAAS